MSEAAYVLLHTVGAAPADVLDRLRKVPGVRTARAVSGPWDIVVYAEAPDPTGCVGTFARIRAVRGVVRTLVCFVEEEGSAGRRA